MSLTRRYDAVVVGAGPAGSTAAARLAEAGLAVALLDRSEPPRDKPCGGGLSPKAYRLLEVDVSDLVLARPRSVVLRAPRSRAVSLESRAGEIWMVQRSAFDQRLVEHAQTRGATLLAGEVVRQVRPGKDGSPASIETDRGLIWAGAVIGADGADSVVGRGAGLRLRRDREYVLALEAEGPRPGGAPSNAALVDFSLRLGYAWFFPKGELSNVGVGTADRRQFRQLRRHLSEFIDRNHLAFAQPPRIVGHKIPVWRGIEPLHQANVVLAGGRRGCRRSILW